MSGAHGPPVRFDGVGAAQFGSGAVTLMLWVGAGQGPATSLPEPEDPEAHRPPPTHKRPSQALPPDYRLPTRPTRRGGGPLGADRRDHDDPHRPGEEEGLQRPYS